MLAFARWSLLVLLPFAGCASPWPKRIAARGHNGTEMSSTSLSTSLSRTTTADWDDVEASLLTAASQSQCSFVSLALVDRAWQGEITSIHDDAALVVVTRETTNATDDAASDATHYTASAGSPHTQLTNQYPSQDPIIFTIVITPTLTSDRALFERFLDATTKRLSQLRGVPTAPLDAPIRPDASPRPAR